MAEFRLTPATLNDLEGIWRYTVEQWGLAPAERYLDALNVSFEALAHAPQSAPPCEHIRPGYRRQLVEHHTVYFRVKVPDNKEVANHVGPESCVVHREMRREALTAACAARG